ncbi:MAG: hypothetical protein ACRD6X_13295 [Pyrinomonadaceae bacterium]
MPIFETGHARNIQRFQEMISFVTSWGAAYAPTNAAISLSALSAKLLASDTAMTAVTSSLAQSKNTVNSRENTFAGLRKLVTRVVNFYESTGADQNKIDDARTLKRKIDGARATTVVDDPNTPEDESANSVSASQQSYTQLVEHFEALIALLGMDPLYFTAELDLQLGTLTALSTQMQSNNLAVINATTALSNARAARDAEMYADSTGLVDLALLTKKYTKAAFGTDSSQYIQIKGLEFTRPR